MPTTHRFLALAATIALATAAGCSNDGPTSPAANHAQLSKSGTAPSGGSGGGGSTAPDSSTGSTSSAGIPVAPSFTARIDSIGVVPTAMYYGTPSQWTIGGYIFEANSLTHLKAANGPLVVGACVSVTFSTTWTGAYLASEIKSETPSRCG